MSAGAAAKPRPASGSSTERKRYTHDEALQLNTGWQMSPERWRDGQARRADLADQTRELARRLDGLGIPASKPSDHVVIGGVTGEVDQVEAYRAIRFLPAIAQRDRRPMLTAMKYFLAEAEGAKYLRYGVVTGGALVEAGGDLKATTKRLKKNISRWASEAEAIYDVEVIFRGCEYTRKRGDERVGELMSLHERDPSRYEPDRYYYHPHANIIYRPRRKLTAERWAEFLRWTKQRLSGVHWRDCGKLFSAEEVVKYAFKPTELAGVTDAELVWLFDQTFRQNDMQPMRSFKEFRASLQNNCELDSATGEIVRKRLKIIAIRGEGLQIVEKSARRRTEPSPLPARDRENLLMAVTAPSARFTPFCEPLLLVAGYTTNPTTIAGRQALCEIEALQFEFRDFWDKNGAPPPDIAATIGNAWVSAKSDDEARKVVALALASVRGRSSRRQAERDQQAAEMRARHIAQRATAMTDERKEGEPSSHRFTVHTCRLSAQHLDDRSSVGGGLCHSDREIGVEIGVYSPDGAMGEVVHSSRGPVLELLVSCNHIPSPILNLTAHRSRIGA